MDKCIQTTKYNPDTDCCKPNKLQQFFCTIFYKIEILKQKRGMNYGKPNPDTPKRISFK